jgi:hypothetical protein
MSSVFIFAWLTITVEALAATARAALYVAALDVKLALNYCAVMTRFSVCAPVVIFFTIANAAYFFPIHDASFDFLGLLNFLRPTFDH